MTTTPSTHTVTGVVALLGVAITAACWGVWGPERGQAAAMGSALGVLNWVALRWLVSRIVGDESSGRAGFSLLLVGKMAALMGIIFVLMNHFSIEPLGLTLGLGVLFVGPVLGSLLVGSRPLVDASTAGSAGEEQ
jgi:hypothetical protein